MTDCYVFNTYELAVGAINEINSSPEFPKAGVNRATGESIANQGLRWVGEPKQRLDGKWFFERLPASEVAKLTQEQITHFMTTYQPTIETFDRITWIGSEEQG